MVEWDLPKGRERQEDYWKYIKETMTPKTQKMDEEGFYKAMSFGDNTGHIIWVLEFEDADAFNKLWNDKEWHNMMSTYAHRVDNLSFRLGRPIIMPE